MVEEGREIVDVSKALGHADINLTMRYHHPGKSLRKTVEGLAERSKRLRGRVQAVPETVPNSKSSGKPSRRKIKRKLP